MIGNCFFFKKDDSTKMRKNTSIFWFFLQVGEGGTIDQYLTKKADIPAMEDMDWHVYPRKDGFEVERMLLLDQRMSLLYKWKSTKANLKIRPTCYTQFFAKIGQIFSLLQTDSFIFSTMSYTTGTSTRVRSVEKSNPPITVIPIGILSSAPSPSPSASGSNPRTVVVVVIIIGRSRILPPSIIASRLGMPSFLRVFIQSTRRIALFTTIPASITTPINTITLMGFEVMNNAITTPTRANGIANIITK